MKAVLDTLFEIIGYYSIIIVRNLGRFNWIQDSLATSKTDSLQAGPSKNASDALNTPDLSEVISGYKIFWAIVFCITGYFIIKIVTRILNLLAEKSANYRITLKSFVPIVKIVGWILIIFIVIAGIFQPPAAMVIGFSASIGVAVGFASQDVLKNIFAGIVILLDRPFNSGDKIEVGSHYGEVTEIGLRSTRIVTPDDSIVTIPNNDIMNSMVSNANTGEPNCQVVAEIYLPVNIDTIKTRELATQAASVSKYIYLKKPIAVLFFHEVREHRTYLKMRLKAYVFDIRDEFAFKSDMTELVIGKLVQEGIIKEG